MYKITKIGEWLKDKFETTIGADMEGEYELSVLVTLLGEVKGEYGNNNEVINDKEFTDIALKLNLIAEVDTTTTERHNIKAVLEQKNSTARIKQKGGD